MSPPVAGELFGSHYRVQRELGRGGMATVYLAEDIKHGRSVALKVLDPEFAASLGAERFRREIAMAARLQHPHIVSVYDSGETAEGLLWFAMPYVAGESLRDRLKRERQLSVDDTIRIVAEIADALQYANAQGILHRDIKPENILLSDGHAMLADFGVARALPRDDGADTRPGGATLTRSGFAVGTPNYMSPEQASGERVIDGRSDEYALAVVAYEMLAGEPPFTAPTPQAVIAKMMASPPPSVRVVRKDVPVGVDAALRKALATTPAARYATPAAFRAGLAAGQHTGTADRADRRTTIAVAVAAAVLVLGGGVGATMYMRAHGSGPAMLAVLPFETEGDTADAWITDGITDEVRGKLASLASVRVIARSSSDQYRGTQKTPQEIGRELGVRYLLTARVRWASGPGRAREIRVDPELVQVADVHTPETRWAQPIDEQASDLFKIQSDIAAQVASALKLAIDPSDRVSMASPPTRDSAAYYAYLRGQVLARNQLPDDMRRAIAEYRRAVEIDPDFALAWYNLAMTMTAWAGRHGTTPAFNDSARAAAQRAAALESHLPDARAALADYEEIVAHDTRRAYADYRAALDRAPNEEFALTGLARTEMRLGVWDSAVAHSQLAAKLDPRWVFAQAALGNVDLLVRHYDAAQRACRQATTLNPANILAVFCAIQVPLARGDLVGARAAIRAASPVVDPTTLYVFLASYGAYTWVLDSAQRRVLLRVPASGYDRGRATWASTQALIYDQAGDAARAAAYADTAARALTADNGPAVADSDPGYAWMLALAGRRAEAVAAADRYLVAHPVHADFLEGPDNAEAVLKAYVRAGAPDKALALLQDLFSIPGRLTPGRIRLDPWFASLEDKPRFQQLLSRPAAGERD